MVTILEKNVRKIGFKIRKITPLTEYSFILIGEK